MNQNIIKKLLELNIELLKELTVKEEKLKTEMPTSFSRDIVEPELQLLDKYQEIFKHWNEKDILVHRKITDGIKKRIDVALKDFTTNEIKQAINNYDDILKSTRTYFKHKWTLEEFLTRANGYRVFLYKTVDDYLEDKK